MAVSNMVQMAFVVMERMATPLSGIIMKFYHSQMEKSTVGEEKRNYLQIMLGSLWMLDNREKM